MTDVSNSGPPGEQTQAKQEEPSFGTGGEEPKPESSAKKGFIITELRSLWWIPASYLVPCLLSGVPEMVKACGVKNLHLYSGAFGFFCAAIIYLLWTLNSTILATAPSASDGSQRETSVLYGLGIALWLTWMTVLHIFLIAQNDIALRLP